jgi:hypothetical protein
MAFPTGIHSKRDRVTQHVLTDSGTYSPVWKAAARRTRVDRRLEVPQFTASPLRRSHT